MPAADSATSEPHPALNHRRTRRLSILLLVLMAAFLLGIATVERYRESEARQEQLVQTVLDAAANEVAIRIAGLQKSVALLAQVEARAIERLAANPDDTATYEELVTRVRGHFPTAFAVTLADQGGEVIYENFDEHVNEVCREDMRHFAFGDQAPGIWIHPNPQGYHFDILAPVGTDGGFDGVFFVSFLPTDIAQMLGASEIPQHEVLLLRNDGARLIEVAPSGSRDRLQRDHLLSDEERSRIRHVVPVAGTRWELAAMPHAGLTPLWMGYLKPAALSLLLLTVLGLYAQYRLRESEKQLTRQGERLQAQERRLQDHHERLHLFQEATATGGARFEDQVHQLLELGRSQFRLQIGILAKVEGERYSVHAAVSPDNVLVPGTEFELGETYCRYTLEAGETTAVCHAGASEWRNHPCYEKFKLETYIGTPVRVAGRTWGTLNFSAAEPCPHPYGAEELEFLGLMARWIGMEMERHQALQSLESNRRQLQGLFDAVADAIVTVDHQGNIHSFNRAAERIFGVSSSTILGTGALQLVPDDLRPRMEKRLRRVLAGRDASALGLAWELSGRRSDGSVFPMELTASRMRIGDQYFITGILRDITERKQAVATLNRFKTTLDHTLDCVFMFDPLSLKFFYVNQGACEQVGYSQQELLQMGPVDIKRDTDEAGFRELLTPLLSGERISLTFNATHDHKDGHQIPVEVFLQYIRPRGETARFVAVVRDISERLAAEQALHANHALLQCISEAQSNFISHRRARELFEEMLRHTLDLTDSEYGFIGEIPTDDSGEPFLRTHAVTHIAWNEETQAFYERHAPNGPEFRNLDTLFGAAIRSQGVVIANQPRTDARSGGLPPGHPDLNAFLGAPVYYGDNRVGLIGIANREGGYDHALVEFLQPLLATCGHLIQAYRNDDRLRQTTAFQNAIFKSTSYLFISTDAEGTIRMFNEAAQAALGYSADEMIGQRTPECFHDYGEVVAAAESLTVELGEPIEPGFRVFVEKARRGIVEERVWTYIRKDGSRFQVSLSISALTDAEGTIIGFLGVAKDITTQLEAEASLRRSEARLAEAQRIAHLGTWEWDHTTGRSFWSDETYRIFGYAPGGISPDLDSFLDHVHLEDRRYVRDLLRSAMEEHGRYVGEYRILRRDGIERMVQDRGEVIYDGRDRPERMIGTVQDITERKKVERMKNEFVSTVSHELRTPLTSIRGSLGLLSGQFRGQLPEKSLPLVDIAYRNSERLLLLINDILDLSKIESGRMQFKFQLLAVGELVEQSLKAHEGYASQHRVRFEAEVTHPDTQVQADLNRLLQVMGNLMSNASKFSPDDSVIRILVRESDDFVEVQVLDQGPGIPAEFGYQVFGKFSQADGSDTRKVSGTGLGLSISKALVEKHGGSIGFENRAGGGCRFYFRIPKTPSQGGTGRAPAGRGTVVICEDDDAMATL